MSELGLTYERSPTHMDVACIQNLPISQHKPLSQHEQAHSSKVATSMSACGFDVWDHMYLEGQVCLVTISGVQRARTAVVASLCYCHPYRSTVFSRLHSSRFAISHLVLYCRG